MKTKKKILEKLTLFFLSVLILTNGAVSVSADYQSSSLKTGAGALGDPGIAMYRVYNPNSGEHFYTSNWNEACHIISLGWRAEGIGWYAPKSGAPVYRLYNKNGGEHFYTLNAAERDHLKQLGWRDEGTGWYSGGSNPVYREYNPNAYANNHNYTTDKTEHDHLVSLGWRNEDIGWNALKTASERMQGIDISQWNYNQNDNYNFDMQPYQGQFVLIRAGYGWSNNPSSATADNYSQMDTKFKQSIQKCEQLGIPYGFYWFSYATNPDEARKEAETFYAVTKNYNPAFGFWMDEEGDNWKNRHNTTYENAANITAIVSSFVGTMQGHGRRTGVYASYNWFNNYISTSAPKWVAHYGRNDGNQDVDLSDEDRHFVMHQYTSNPIDKNLLYVSYTDLFR